jgi:hypothetical protein
MSVFAVVLDLGLGQLLPAFELHRSLGAAPGCQRGPAGHRRRAAADRPRRRRLLIPPPRKCSAKPPTRLGLPRLFSYLVNRTVEDGL